MLRARILVVEGFDLLRDVMCEIVRKDPALCVVGEARDAHEAEEMVLAKDPDVVLINMAIPGGGGLAFTRHLTRRRPALPIIIMGDDVGTEYAHAAYRAGASAYLSRQQGANGLLKVIHGTLRSCPQRPRQEGSSRFSADFPMLVEVK